ncbi:MAG: hypothetical protein ACK6A9_06560 [Dolichospermum sp.]|jgi:hypothetical protein
MQYIQRSILQSDNENISLNKRKQGGQPTSDLIMSAYLSGNAEVFANILQLHVPEGSIVADVTWGKGVFWQNVLKDKYKLLATDISTGVDCKNR